MGTLGDALSCIHWEFKKKSSMHLYVFPGTLYPLLGYFKKMSRQQEQRTEKVTKDETENHDKEK